VEALLILGGVLVVTLFVITVDHFLQKEDRDET
jgi:hypothetical protein